MILIQARRGCRFIKCQAGSFLDTWFDPFELFMKFKKRTDVKNDEVLQIQTPTDS